MRVPNPRLLLACPEDPDLSANCSARTVSAFCDETGQEKCDWINVPYKVWLNYVLRCISFYHSHRASKSIQVYFLVKGQS